MSTTHPAQVTEVTGGVSRPLADKLGEIVSVRDYGAVGNGITDDTAAVQNALADVGGKTLLFPDGTYKITDTLAVSVAGTLIRGQGAKIFMALASGHATGRLFYVTASNVTFDGVWIDSTGTATTTTGNKYAIQFVGTTGAHLSNIRVRNCQFTNLPWQDYAAVFATHCIYAIFVDGLSVRNNRIDNVGGAGVFMSNVVGSKILDNDINNTGWYSIQFNDGCDGSLVRGNRITGNGTGNAVQTRLWGGSLNLMSNSTTGGHLGTGNARIKRVEIANNYISGAHSYTAAVHIESSSYISFHHNIMEGIYLTQPSDFYPNPQPPDYVRVYTRPLQPDPSGTEGPNDHIDISDNLMIANGISGLAIYVDAQSHAAALAYSDTLTIRNNRIVSLDTSNYFAKGIIVHGQEGGWKNIGITKNMVSGFPDTSSPVGGLIGIIGLTGAPVTDTQIEGNVLTVIGGTPSTTVHLGIAIDAFTQRTLAQNNIVNGFWDGIRTFTNASAVYFGSGNSFNASGSLDYLIGVAPSVPFGVGNRYASLFLTGRTSALSATTLVSLAPAGEYRISVTARTSTSGTGTTGTVSIIWTDEGGVKTFTTATFALNAVDVTGQVNATLFIHAANSTNIQVSVAGTFGTSQYAFSAVAERLN